MQKYFISPSPCWHHVPISLFYFSATTLFTQNLELYKTNLPPLSFRLQQHFYFINWGRSTQLIIRPCGILKQKRARLRAKRVCSRCMSINSSIFELSTEVPELYWSYNDDHAGLLMDGDNSVDFSNRAVISENGFPQYFLSRCSTAFSSSSVYVLCTWALYGCSFIILSRYRIFSSLDSIKFAIRNLYFMFWTLQN